MCRLSFDWHALLDDGRKKSKLFKAQSRSGVEIRYLAQTLPGGESMLRCSWDRDAVVEERAFDGN